MVFFKIWASTGRDPADLLAVTVALLIYCASVIVVALRWDKPTYFDWTACGYFLVLAMALSLRPESTGAIVSAYAVTGIYICLFSAAFFPVILGFAPFAYHYSKKRTPKEVWDNPLFVAINRIITFGWAVLCNMHHAELGTRWWK